MRVPYVVWRRYHIHVVLAVLLLQSTALLASGDCSSVQGLWAQTVTDGIIDRNQMTYYNNGVQSALNQQKNINLMLKSTGSASDVTSLANSNPNALFFVGLGVAQNTDAAMTSSAVTSRNMVNIGSASCGNKQRYWNQWTYFTASEEVIQNALAVQYAVTVLRHRRICVYSGLEDEYGWNGYNMQVNYLNKVGYVQNTDYYVYKWSQGYAAYQKLNIQSLMLFDYNGDFVQNLFGTRAGPRPA
eukprot:gene10788-biopygen7710